MKWIIRWAHPYLGFVYYHYWLNHIHILFHDYSSTQIHYKFSNFVGGPLGTRMTFHKGPIKFSGALGANFRSQFVKAFHCKGPAGSQLIFFNNAAWSTKCYFQPLTYTHLKVVGTVCAGARLNIKMSSYQYRDPHVKDKIVSWASYL